MSNELPTVGFIRARQLLGILPIRKTTLWQWVKNSKLPKPIRLSKGVTVWRVEDVRAFLENAANHETDDQHSDVVR
jgi:predicted DNA-binding transcriptional regulator AlpA